MLFLPTSFTRLARTVACLVVVWGLAACSPSGETTEATDEPAGRERSFEFRYQALLPAMPEGAKTYRIWIPLPAETEEQRIHDLKIVSPVRYEQRVEDVYGNRYVYIDLEPGSYPWPLSVTLGFEVTRKENRVHLETRASSPESVAHAAEDLEKFLQPNRLIPLDGLIGDLSRQHTAGAKSDLDKARRVYDYVVGTMSYDKSGEGWGRGDALFACDVKKGNCTDFHALFIGMMRAAGIPARFEIGFPLPADKSRGEIGGVSLLGAVLSGGRGLGSRRCFRGLERSLAQRLLLRGARSAPRAFHHGPRLIAR